MRTGLVILLALAFVPATACRHKDAPAVPVPPESPRPLDTAGLSLAERLQRESASRPAGTPRFEDLAGALGRSGLPLSGGKQVLAEILGARYCAAARTARGLGVSVCEFASPDGARRGRDYSTAAFDRLIPRRTLLLNRQTLLTLTRPDDNAGLDAESASAAAAFAAL